MDTKVLELRVKSMVSILNERQKRLYLALEAESYGNPCNTLSWTTKSTRKLADKLAKEGFTASHTKAGELEEGCSLQGNRKMLQVGESHIDRDAQFAHINTTEKTMGKMDSLLYQWIAKRRKWNYTITPH